MSEWWDAKENRRLLKPLLYQLADDNFIHAYRGSEWLGLAPHIEEDVAFSSINQDTMGHASMYFKHLEELGEGSVDHLSQLRNPEEFRNAIIIELKNGPGEYTGIPDYDWAFTVIRHLFYDQAKKIRLQSLKQSAYEPLAVTARKIMTEQTYHLMHWTVWFKQLMQSTDEARERMETAITTAWDNFGGVLTLGVDSEAMTAVGLIEGEDLLQRRWLDVIEDLFAEVGMTMPSEKPGMKLGDGRKGEHSEELTEAVEHLAEVYRSDREAPAW